jgi:hypothetical protein
MWRVIIHCSGDAWKLHAKDFNAIAAKYPATPLSTKKMREDERRIMEYQLENVSDAEEFQDDCMTLEGFTAMFEAL